MLRGADLSAKSGIVDRSAAVSMYTPKLTCLRQHTTKVNHTTSRLLTQDATRQAIQTVADSSGNLEA